MCGPCAGISAPGSWRSTEGTVDLLSRFMVIAGELREVFGQQRSARRAVSLMLAGLLCLGRHWISRWRLLRGGDLKRWSADYKLFSRARWEPDRLFDPAIRHGLPFTGSGPIVLAGDETRLRRGGRRVKRSRWTRDPLSPPFHVNFMKGIRFCQFSLLLPLYRLAGVDARAVPVSFRPVDLPAKPRRSAPPEQHAAYREACKLNRMCLRALEQLHGLRAAFDRLGAGARRLLVALDGGFCNRTLFGDRLERIELLARCRKDAVLCRRAHDRRCPSRVYGRRTFTPESVRCDGRYPWRRTTVFFGGRWRTVKYKELRPVLWRGGAGRRALRLLVVAPTPYRLSPAAPLYYRQPAYLLSTDLKLPAHDLLQAYFDRWQIEVNHRDEKQQIGIAHPQVWNDRSVDRQPAFLAAGYSFLLLAALEAYGPRRTDHYLQPPPWQRSRRSRPSCEDLLAVLRTQAAERDGPAPNDMPFHYDPKTAVASSVA